MSARKSSSVKRRLVLGVSLLPVLALGACADYLNHNDSVTASAGDANAHNKVIHIADPWPRAAANSRIGGNGQLVDIVTKRYLAGGGASSSNPAADSGGAPASAKPPASGQAPN
jgi:hypothetical protein